MPKGAIGPKDAAILVGRVQSEGIDPKDIETATKLAGFHARPDFLVRRANQISVSAFAEDLGELGITPTQMSSLIVITESPGIDQITLGRRIGVDRTTVSMVVNALEQHGFVRREQSARDARRNEINATRAGNACTVLARELARENNRKLLGGFSDEAVGRFIAFLRRLIDKVPNNAPEWVRPDGTTSFGTESDFEAEYPEHVAMYNAFGFLLRRSHQTLESTFIESCKPLKLTPRRYSVLKITEQCQTVEQIALSLWLGLDGSTTATVVADLADRGWITRATHLVDKRRRILKVAPEGRAILKAAKPMVQRASQNALDVLGTDADEFLSLMRRFIVSNEGRSRVPILPAVTAQIMCRLGAAA